MPRVAWITRAKGPRRRHSLGEESSPEEGGVVGEGVDEGVGEDGDDGAVDVGCGAAGILVTGGGGSGKGC